MTETINVVHGKQNQVANTYSAPDSIVLTYSTFNSVEKTKLRHFIVLNRRCQKRRVMTGLRHFPAAEM